MGLGSRSAKHETNAARKLAVVSSEYWEYQPKTRVMTVDGILGTVTAVSDGPYPGTEEYQVTLDDGMGGGAYTASQLRPASATTASHEHEATGVHTADQDYPELGSILHDRPPIERIQYTAAHRTAAYWDDDGDAHDDELDSHGDNDWDDIHSGLEEIHRGLHTTLPHDLHRFVHDDSRPMHERAHALLEHVRQGDPQRSSDHGLGTHWTDSHRIAEDFADGGTARNEALQNKRKVLESRDRSWGTNDSGDPKGQPVTSVVLHAHQPDRDSIDDHADPMSHGSSEIYGFHDHPEREVPIHPGAEVPVKGISWREVHHFDDEPDDFDDEYKHHEFSETRHHRASLGGGNPFVRTASAEPAFESGHKDAVYLRFGKWPKDERSQNNVTGHKEDGVSVYDLDKHGHPMDPDPGYNRGHEHDEYCEEDCDLDSWNEDYGNDTREEMQGRVHRAERARHGGQDRHTEVGHLVKGEMVGFGHDGEPLLRKVKRVGDWINDRHKHIPTAEPHHLAEIHHTAASVGSPFEVRHVETDTGGTKFPRRVDTTAHHPETGEEAGSARYFPPKRKGGPISIDEVRGHAPGAASAMLNDIEARHPGSKTVFLHQVKRNNNNPDVTGHAHERAGQPSDWDTHYPNLADTVHRGLSLKLDPWSARTVNSSAHTKDEHVAEIHKALGTSSAGTHWTEDEHAARLFAHNATSDHRTEIPVVLHARTPDRKHIETRRDHLYRGGVFPYGDSHSSENEVPIRKGREVAVTGISWRPDAAHPDADENGWLHHTYDEPKHHTAGSQPPTGEPMAQEIPSACSSCGSDDLSVTGDTGRSVQATCNVCNATMSSWGGQFTPELIGDPSNHPDPAPDPASGASTFSAPVRIMDTTDHIAAFSTWHLASEDDDYRMQHQPMDAEDGSPLHDVTLRGHYPSDVYSHTHHYADYSDPTVHESVDALSKAQGNGEVHHVEIDPEHAHEPLEAHMRDMFARAVKKQGSLSVTAAGRTLSWDEVGQHYPHVYGDPEVHGDAADGGDGEGIGYAVNHLAHSHPGDPHAENASVHDLEFHPEWVDLKHVDHNSHGGLDDPRVKRAYEGYRGGDARSIPPLVVVHRHGVYQVADGHHRAEGAKLAGKEKVPAFVAHSPHPDEPFGDGEKGPFHGAEPVGGSDDEETVNHPDDIRKHMLHDHDNAHLADAIGGMSDEKLHAWHSRYDCNALRKQTYLRSIVSSLDAEGRWHFTASWSDVRDKAKRLRSEGAVNITVASGDGIGGEVKGDTNVYETVLSYIPGSQKVAYWTCGCKWAAYAWGRSPAYKRFEGRMCSHALAMQFEAQARGMFGKNIEPDVQRPSWMRQRTPVVVKHQRDTGEDLTRRAVPPGNMRRTFEGSLNSEPEEIAPVFAAVAAALAAGEDPTEVMKSLSAIGYARADARTIVRQSIDVRPSCPDCGQPVGMNAVRCPHCGAELHETDPAEMHLGSRHTGSEERWYHGTRYDLKPGQVLTGGHMPSNQGYGQPGEHVYYSGRGDVAVHFADAADGPEDDYDAKPKVYQVEPIEGHEPDPDEEEHHRSYRAKSVRVVRKIPLGVARMYTGSKVDTEPEETGPTHAGLVLKARDTGRILMLQRSMEDADDPHGGRWEFPGGGIEPGDPTSLHAGIREWEEEVGQKFPHGGALHHVWSAPGGCYHGHVVVIPNESMVDLSQGRVLACDSCGAIATSRPSSIDHVGHVVGLRTPAQMVGIHANGSVTGMQRVFLGTRGPLDGSLQHVVADVDPSIGSGHHHAGVTVGVGAERPVDAFGDRPGLFEALGDPGEGLSPRMGGSLGGASPLETEPTGVAEAVPSSLNAVAPVCGACGGSLHVRHYNPDDPGGDNHEQAAWWEIEHARKNPALREEVKRSPWKEIAKAGALPKEAAAWDSLSEFSGMPLDPPPHSNSENPGSTGFATSMDPPEFDNPDWNVRNMELAPSYLAMLHEDPEPALPSTDGGEHDDDFGILPSDYRETRSEIPPTDVSALPNQFTGGVQDIVARFQATAGARMLNSSGGGRASSAGPSDVDIAGAAKAFLEKKAVKTFSFQEQQELITEGAVDRVMARNVDRLDIGGTHYAAIDDALAAQGMDVDPDELFI